jgi:hypothetical protein
MKRSVSQMPYAPIRSKEEEEEVEEEEEEITAGTTKTIIFWNVTPCSLAEVN